MKTILILLLLTSPVAAGWGISVSGQPLGAEAFGRGDTLTAALIVAGDPGPYEVWLTVADEDYHYPDWGPSPAAIVYDDGLWPLLSAFLCNGPDWTATLNARSVETGEERSEEISFFGVPLPTPIPYASPTPLPQAMGWRGGEIVFELVGADAPFDPDADSGVILSLTNDDCGVFSARLVHWGDGWRYHCWMVGDSRGDNAAPGCWSHWPYWDSLPATDGVWRVTWAAADGATTATVCAPDGTSETLTVPYVIAYRDAHAGPTVCDRPRARPVTTTEILEMRWDDFGAGTECRE